MPCALRLRREERLERTLADVVVHADAEVADGQADVAPRLQVDVVGRVGLVDDVVRRLDDQAAAVGHRVARIDREIDEHLLELAGIGLDGPEVHAETSLEHHPLAERPMEQVLEPGNDVVEVEHLGLDDFAAAEDEQLPRELRSALRRLRGSPRRPRASSGLLGQRVGGELGVVDDDPEQVVEVVRDTARKLADALEATRLVELLGQRSLTLGLGAIADVAHGRCGDDAGLGLDARDVDLRRELGGVLAHANQLDTRRGRYAGEVRAVAVARVGRRPAEPIRDDQLDRLADELGAVVAEQLLGALVGEHDPAVGATADDRVGRELQELREHALGANRLVQRRIGDRGGALGTIERPAPAPRSTAPARRRSRRRTARCRHRC